MTDLLAIDGVTYWYRLREIAWHWLHERLIWERIVAGAAGSWEPATAPASIVVPGHETALREVVAAVARARGIDVEFVPAGGPPAGNSDVAPIPAPAAAAGSDAGRPQADRTGFGRLAGRLRRLTGGEPERPPAAGRALAAARADTLAKRLSALAADPLGPILVLTNTRLQQRIGDPGTRRVEDPNLGPVIAELRRTGLDPVVIGLGLDETRDADWPAIESDPRLLPQSVLRRWRGPEDSASQAADLVRARVRSAAAVPLDVHGVDLAPALTAGWGAGGLDRRDDPPPDSPHRRPRGGPPTASPRPHPRGDPDPVAAGRARSLRPDLRRAARDDLPDAPGVSPSPRLRASSCRTRRSSRDRSSATPSWRMAATSPTRSSWWARHGSRWTIRRPPARSSRPTGRPSAARWVSRRATGCSWCPRASCPSSAASCSRRRSSASSGRPCPASTSSSSSIRASRTRGHTASCWSASPAPAVSRRRRSPSSGTWTCTGCCGRPTRTWGSSPPC